MDRVVTAVTAENVDCMPAIATSWPTWTSDQVASVLGAMTTEDVAHLTVIARRRRRAGPMDVLKALKLERREAREPRERARSTARSAAEDAQWEAGRAASDDARRTVLREYLGMAEGRGDTIWLEPYKLRRSAGTGQPTRSRTRANQGWLRKLYRRIDKLVP